MVDNKGNSYRTRGAVVTAAAIIAIALGLLICGLGHLAWLNMLWIFLLVFGLALIAVGFVYSSVPDKFGPSEQTYRVAAGAVLALFGFVGIIWQNTKVGWFVYVAVLLIGIALIGMTVAVGTRKSSKF